MYVRARRTNFYIKFTRQMCAFVLVYKPSMIMFHYRACRAKSDFSGRARLNIGFFFLRTLLLFWEVTKRRRSPAEFVIKT